jgi:hypothetical protein
MPSSPPRSTARAEGWELATMFSASADVRAHEVQSDAISFKRPI